MDKIESGIFLTEFPKDGFSLIDQLQGRVQFAILDQIKMMRASGMEYKSIRETILTTVEKIIETYKAQEEKF